MRHAPVVSRVNNTWEMIPLHPLPDGKEWKDVIGFDPIMHFGQVSIEDSYLLNVWSRDNLPLPTIELLIDPGNSSRRLSHGAYVDFSRIPVFIVPSSILLLWLHYHGIPMNKTSQRQELRHQVQRAIDLDQPLDEDNILSSDSTTARSYVSIDNINILSSVEWTTDGNACLGQLREIQTPSINATYINDVFGEGKNGIRERAWLRMVSGHLDIDTLRFTQTRAMVDRTDTQVNIFEIKVTPSMKNLVYSVYVAFSSSGVYIPTSQDAIVRMVGYFAVTHLLCSC